MCVFFLKTQFIREKFYLNVKQFLPSFLPPSLPFFLPSIGILDIENPSGRMPEWKKQLKSQQE